MTTAATWSEVEGALRHQPPGAVLEVARDVMPSPTSVGMRRSVGLPVGQSVDWRKALSDGRSLHVREYGDAYRCHLDDVDPSVSVVDHLRQDAPVAWVVAGSLLGAAVGVALGRSLGGALWGAAAGGAVAGVALLMPPVADPAPVQISAGPKM